MQNSSLAGGISPVISVRQNDNKLRFHGLSGFAFAFRDSVLAGQEILRVPLLLRRYGIELP